MLQTLAQKSATKALNETAPEHSQGGPAQAVFEPFSSPRQDWEPQLGAQYELTVPCRLRALSRPADLKVLPCWTATQGVLVACCITEQRG